MGNSNANFASSYLVNNGTSGTQSSALPEELLQQLFPGFPFNSLAVQQVGRQLGYTLVVAFPRPLIWRYIRALATCDRGTLSTGERLHRFEGLGLHSTMWHRSLRNLVSLLRLKDCFDAFIFVQCFDINAKFTHQYANFVHPLTL